MPDAPPLDVRPARPADVGAIRRVARRAWHAAHAPIVGEAAVEAFLEEHYDAGSVRARVDRDDVVLDVATDPSGDLLGFVAASPRDDDSDAFDLNQLYVAPDCWGEGVGRRLLAAAERAIASRGGRRVRLGVMAENDRAVGFYEAAGYRRVGTFHDERVGAVGYSYERALE